MPKRKSKVDTPGSKRVPIYLNPKEARLIEKIVEKGEWKSYYAYAKKVLLRHMRLMNRIYEGEMVPDPLGIALKADYGTTPVPVPISGTIPQNVESMEVPRSGDPKAHGAWMQNYIKAQKAVLAEREGLLEHMSEVRSALKKDLSTSDSDEPVEEPTDGSPMGMMGELKSIFNKKKKQVPPIE
jgi:hypothetical protein